MAPEQAAGAPPDPRQDLYAAGVVAAELLGGRIGPLNPLLDALTDPDPDLRPPTAAAALERLRRIDVPDDGPWPEVPDRLGEPPAEAAEHRWANVVIVASLVVIALCVVANVLMLW
jgi:serine/threonine-protein kinase